MHKERVRMYDLLQMSRQYIMPKPQTSKDLGYYDNNIVDVDSKHEFELPQISLDLVM